MNSTLTIRAAAWLMIPVAFALTACGDNPVSPDDDHPEAEGVVILDLQGNLIAEYDHDEDAWELHQSANQAGTALSLTNGGTLSVRFMFVDHDGDRFLPDEDEGESLHVQITPSAVVSFADLGTHQELTALTVGSAELQVRLMHGTHADFETVSGLTLEVVAP